MVNGTQLRKQLGRPVNRMDPIVWVPPSAQSLLDVGCNVGELLSVFRAVLPHMTLAGVDVNPTAVVRAQAALPGVDIRRAGAECLPFPDGSFDCVTCVEVLEHIPDSLRPAALAQMHRVLRVGGQLILRVPHAGAFAWMDSNNLRFRFPRLYSALVGGGRRDSGYEGGAADVVWHEHYTRDQIIQLAGAGWRVEAMRRGGLFLLPLTDLFAWPFYRVGRTDNPVFRALQRVAAMDVARDFGGASFDMLLVLRRV
jgi:SAM-dependent methyltransferase